MTPKRKAISFTVVNLIHGRLTPTRPFSKRSPTLWLPTFNENSAEILRIFYNIRKQNKVRAKTSQPKPIPHSAHCFN
ncbi:MAG: hypothetical protein LBK82_15735 [Planctomycetaceae bacterium]|nr:hypothetical protein [Planctomycetaceae bacterium]